MTTRKPRKKTTAKKSAVKKSSVKRTSPKKPDPLRSPGMPPSPRYLDRNINVCVVAMRTGEIVVRGPLVSAAEAFFLHGPIDGLGGGGDILVFDRAFVPVEGFEVPEYRWDIWNARWNRIDGKEDSVDVMPPDYFKRIIQVCLVFGDSGEIVSRGPAMLSAAEAYHICEEGGWEEFAVRYIPMEGFELDGFKWDRELTRWIPQDWVRDPEDGEWCSPKHLQHRARREKELAREVRAKSKAPKRKTVPA